ncbi:hypothetical protein PoB_004990200 [Plakobranchus ocellatus]|uniref:Uncharacterized protein n=1 Tax=Plakobranchus ocellatus TaxID=259542 RepID=A0AAV4BVN8_9GAST|nr:hypothetical protein PoB_004990200 [Plakobranchus ocellatus]
MPEIGPKPGGDGGREGERGKDGGGGGEEGKEFRIMCQNFSILKQKNKKKKRKLRLYVVDIRTVFLLQYKVSSLFDHKLIRCCSKLYGIIRQRFDRHVVSGQFATKGCHNCKASGFR